MTITKLISGATIAALALPFAIPAQAQQPAGQTMEVVERAPNGRALVVRIDGQSYAVCSELVQDGCINPHEAGLKWGNRPLSYWPGMPASELREKRTDIGG